MTDERLGKALTEGLTVIGKQLKKKPSSPSWRASSLVRCDAMRSDWRRCVASLHRSSVSSCPLSRNHPRTLWAWCAYGPWCVEQARECWQSWSGRSN